MAYFVLRCCECDAMIPEELARANPNPFQAWSQNWETGEARCPKHTAFMLRGSTEIPYNVHL